MHTVGNRPFDTHLKFSSNNGAI
ncbi:hypothetical protein PMI16_01973, partial [Herbaspirillum sp. CF444]